MTASSRPSVFGSCTVRVSAEAVAEDLRGEQQAGGLDEDERRDGRELERLPRLCDAPAQQPQAQDLGVLRRRRRPRPPRRPMNAGVSSTGHCAPPRDVADRHVLDRKAEEPGEADRLRRRADRLRARGDRSPERTSMQNAACTAAARRRCGARRSGASRELREQARAGYADLVGFLQRSSRRTVPDRRRAARRAAAAPRPPSRARHASLERIVRALREQRVAPDDANRQQLHERVVRLAVEFAVPDAGSARTPPSRRCRAAPDAGSPRARASGTPCRSHDLARSRRPDRRAGRRRSRGIRRCPSPRDCDRGASRARQAAYGRQAADGSRHTDCPSSKYAAHHFEISSIMNAVRDALRSPAASESSTSATVATTARRAWLSAARRARAPL